MNNDPKDLLRACAESLLSAVSRLENASSSQHSPVRLPSPMACPLTPSEPSSNTTPHLVRPAQVPITTRPTASEEHRSLFGHKPPSNSKSNHRQPPSKRKMVTSANGEHVSIPVRNTWSRPFVCLPKRNATTAPTATEKVSMALAGLDDRTICFTKGGNSEHVHKKILEAFPMLADVGGYQILRTGEHSNRQLMVLAIPPGGYTVAYLKSTIGTAKGYLRPYQKDIVIDESTVIGKGQTQVRSFSIPFYSKSHLNNITLHVDIVFSAMCNIVNIV